MSDNKQEQSKPAKPEAAPKKGAQFFVVEKRAESERVLAVTEAELHKLVDVDTELFTSEKEAQERCDAIQRQRVIRGYQKARARAKVERDRAAFAAQHPQLAKELKSREEAAREKSRELEESRKA